MNSASTGPQDLCWCGQSKCIYSRRIEETNEWLDEARRQARDVPEVQKINLIQAVLNGH